MAILLGSIADDYTGASDLANTLTKNGLRTVQTVGIPDPSLALPDVDAVVVSLKIRSVPASDAVAAAASAERWLRQRGAGHAPRRGPGRRLHLVEDDVRQLYQSQHATGYGARQ